MLVRIAAIVLLICLLVTPRANADNQAYRLGPEDVITIAVARHADFSGDFYIPADGIVNLPSIGSITAGGKTLDELAADVKSRLSDRLRDPEVTVSLKMARMQRVYVLGAVSKPGLYDMKPGWRITESVAAAGGLAAGIETTDCCATILRASTGERETVKLSDVFQGVEDANVGVNSGDVITVNAEETIPVYVMGKVKTPGLYRVRKDSAGVAVALTLAGGITDDAAINRVTITHLNGESQVVDLAPALLQGKQESSSPLQSGDLVVVPEETAKVAVLGFVNAPGFFPMKSGVKLTLSEALGLARGADKRGKLSAVAIIRTQGDEQKRLVCNLDKFLRSGDKTQNPEVLPGDVIYVSQTNKPEWNTIFNAVTSVGFLLRPF
ncbi:MAG TPA: polysaccharide biosynthesis/export family protein [Armatimonadota bacterium]|nr:polysaccharide biosynthesis/export family protein [Armatimonadota bacterium]